MPKRDRRTDRIAVSISRVGIDVLARDENIVKVTSLQTHATNKQTSRQVISVDS